VANSGVMAQRVSRLGIKVAEESCMRGCITEVDFEEADRCFPGIAKFYRSLASKPATFLELVWAFLDEGGCAEDPVTGSHAQLP
jgi:hypothetical protein